DRRPVAELAVVISSPRPYGAVGSQSEGAISTPRHGYHISQVTIPSGPSALDRGMAGGRLPVTELAVAISSPRPHSAVGFEGEGVLATRSHRYYISQVTLPAAAFPYATLFPADRRPVAELAVVITPPRPHGAVGFQSEGVIVTRRHSYHI